jgi:ribonuclease P protein component
VNRSANRLRTPADFATARERAERGWPHRLLVLYVAPNDLDNVRVGITVSRRVGNAVTRNRVRRRLRELLSARLPRLKDGQDLLLVARPSSAGASWEELGLAVDTLLSRAHATSNNSVLV